MGKRLVAEDIGIDWDSVQRLRVLALLKKGEESLEARDHELVFGLHLKMTSAEVQKTFEKRRATLLGSAKQAVDAKAQKAATTAVANFPVGIAFVAAPGAAAPGTAPAMEEKDCRRTLDFDGLVANVGEERLTVPCRKALELLRALRSSPD